MIARLKKVYEEKIIPEMKQKFNLSNRFQVPRLEKIVLNVGLGNAKDNPNLLKSVVSEMAAITGQKPVVTKARKSVASFKIREGQSVGVKVTLRNAMMYEFFDRLVNVALPRVKDFKGLSPKSFDKFGNYSFGIKEQIIFPEINYDKVNQIHGMDIILVLTGNNRELSLNMLKMMGMPIREK